MHACRRLFPALIGTALLSLVPSAVHADPITLASAAIRSGGTTLKGDASGRFIFAVTPIANVQLFSEHVLTAADIGTTFVADASNDPDFAEVARQLTNGVGNYIETQFASSGGIGGVGYPHEGVLFGLSTPDLAGSTITAFTFRLDSLSSAPFDARFDMQTMTGVLSAIGTGEADPPSPTPEPASLLLLGTGAAALVARARRRGAQ